MGEYVNTYASLVKFVQDFITNNATQSGTQFLDFDQHADMDKLPPHDLVGLRGFSVDVSSITMEVQVLFCLTTYDDKSGFRHRALADKLFTALLPTKKVPYVDADTGNVLGYLIANNATSVLPVSKDSTRVFQQITVSLQADRKPTL